MPADTNGRNPSALAASNYRLAKFANICHDSRQEDHPMATLNISLPDEMRQWIDTQVASGRYANASDYIRDLIRSNQSTTDLIRLALIEGEQSGESPRSVSDIMASEQARHSR
jgi:antitoxin ParD1/3/4